MTPSNAHGRHSKSDPLELGESWSMTWPHSELLTSMMALQAIWMCSIMSTSLKSTDWSSSNVWKIEKKMRDTNHEKFDDSNTNLTFFSILSLVSFSMEPYFSFTTFIANLDGMESCRTISRAAAIRISSCSSLLAKYSTIRTRKQPKFDDAFASNCWNASGSFSARKKWTNIQWERYAMIISFYIFWSLYLFAGHCVNGWWEFLDPCFRPMYTTFCSV